MNLKEPDTKQPQIDDLERLLQVATGDKKNKIQKELNMLRAGIKGEQETIYHINFNLRDSKNYAVIHDLRLEINGNVAQIDHLLINKTLRIYCLETKHFNSGFKINDDGEFLQWNSLKKAYEGIPSPLAQNKRHISVLNDIFDTQIKLPEKLGYILYPSFHSRIVINNNARIERSAKFDSKELVKSEQLFESIKNDFDDLGIGIGIGTLLKIVSYREIEDIANQLIKLHKPINIDYTAKYGLENSNHIKPAEPVEVKSAVIKPPTVNTNGCIHKCKKCNSQNVKILYGKFGYYYKCSDCEGNTNIEVECGVARHKAKLRKNGNRFYKDCPECKSSSLYYEN
ncbi:MAG: NERD domain-containing protein [Methylotenera sp.]|nr:NERD domain-containing protein [Methylotenera sp.]